MSYMYKDDLIYVEYTTSDGKITTYNVFDRKGKVVEQRLPFPLQEYTIDIPKDLEVRRESQTLSNGFQRIHVVLKWDQSFDYILDTEGKLQQFSCKGGAQFDNRNKVITTRKVDE